MSSSKWSAYEDLCYTRMLDKIEKGMHLHMYSAISKMHSKLSESFGQMDDSMRSLEQQVTEMRFGSVSKSNPRISSPARLRPMPRTDFFTGEIATELLKALLYIVGKSSVCKSSAKHFITTIKRYVSIVQEIKDSGEELPEVLQCELDRFHKEIKKAQMLCYEIINTGKWNVYKNLRYSWKLDEIDKGINRFNLGSMQLHMYASICKMSSKTRERFDQIEGSMKRIQQQITDNSISGSWVEKAIQSQGQEQSMWEEEGLGQRVVIGLEAGKKKVKQMLMTLREDLRIVGIHGIGGSGKTTLAKEIFRDEQIKEHFNNKMLFLTVSQSPNINYLKARILGFLMGSDSSSMHNRIPAWFPQYGGLNCMPVPALIVLDDVWNFKDLELLMLIEGYSGCKILVVSRSRFPVVVQTSYEVECLKEHEAMTLFCLSAFQQPSIPPGANENLVKQVVNECKGLPLALKVMGGSLRGQPEMFWCSARNRLQRGLPIDESHENNLLEKMKISFDHLDKKMKECFLDLGSFLEDRPIPLDILINMWMEVHDLHQEDAYVILYELANKNLLTLVKDRRAGEICSSCYDDFVTMHDVLRDLALHLNNQGEVNEREQLVMPRREAALPRDWERHSDQPFKARIVSIHTGGISEMDWPKMELPKSEVLILNFKAKEYFFPPFMADMRKLCVLILINQDTSNAVLQNFSVFSSLINLKSLWLEKVNVPDLSKTTIPFTKLQKISLILCKVNSSLDPSVVDLPRTFPCISDLTFDHCDDMMELPSSICMMQSLKSLRVTNCHGLRRLPPNMDQLTKLETLRIYACPNLRTLPPGICELRCLKYLDISGCVKLVELPERIGNLISLELIDMRECSQIRCLPKSVMDMQSLKRIICDEEISPVWRDVKRARPELHLQVVEVLHSGLPA